MRTSYRTGLIATVLLAAAALAPSAGARQGQQHAQHVVRSGQSIQAALDAARPGDTVLVLAGVYRENLEITTDRITLRGAGARLEPPATPTPRRCSTLFGRADNPYGICLAGELDPSTGAVTREVRGVTIEGLTVGEFAESGIVAFGSGDTVIQGNDIAGGKGDSGYSVLLLRSSGSTVLRNRVHGAGGAGIYIGSSPDARARIAYNVATNSGSLGIMVRDSVGGTVEHNVTVDNCMGLGFVDGLSAGTAQSWTARENVVVRNTRVCPGEPDVSGVGVLLAGARDITVERNLVLGNRPASESVPYGGGIVLASGSLFGGTEVASGITVTGNTVVGNAPADVNVSEAGPGNTFTRNTCRTSLPTGWC